MEYVNEWLPNPVAVAYINFFLMNQGCTKATYDKLFGKSFDRLAANGAIRTKGERRKTKVVLGHTIHQAKRTGRSSTFDDQTLGLVSQEKEALTETCQ